LYYFVFMIINILKTDCNSALCNLHRFCEFLFLSFSHDLKGSGATLLVYPVGVVSQHPV